jgi:cytochrome c oxidase cbb3-type subunit 3
MRAPRRRRRLAAASLALALLAASCDRGGEALAPPAARPAVNVPVGPVPGVATASFESNPYGTDPVALMEGRRLFVAFNCAGCHGGHGGGGMGPSLRDVSWVYGSSDAQVFDSIAAGRAHGMPAWGTRLPQEYIWKLAGYVKSLESPREPEPPQ